MMILLVYLGLKITILLVLLYPVFPQYPALSCLFFCYLLHVSFKIAAKLRILFEIPHFSPRKNYPYYFQQVFNKTNSL